MPQERPQKSRQFSSKTSGLVSSLMPTSKGTPYTSFRSVSHTRQQPPVPGGVPHLRGRAVHQWPDVAKSWLYLDCAGLPDLPLPGVPCPGICLLWPLGESQGMGHWSPQHTLPPEDVLRDTCFHLLVTGQTQAGKVQPGTPSKAGQGH